MPWIHCEAGIFTASLLDRLVDPNGKVRGWFQAYPATQIWTISNKMRLQHNVHFFENCEVLHNHSVLPSVKKMTIF